MWSSVDILHLLLRLHRGMSTLDVKERVIVFQLMQWNGDFQRAKSQGLGQDGVLQSLLNTPIDERLRRHLVVTWASAGADRSWANMPRASSGSAGTRTTPCVRAGAEVCEREERHSSRSLCHLPARAGGSESAGEKWCKIWKPPLCGIFLRISKLSLGRC